MKRILSFSSDPLFNSAIEEQLKDTHYVQSASDLHFTIEILNKDFFDAIIVDSDSQPLDGIDVFKTIKRTFPRVRAILFSNKGDISEAVTATKLGVMDFLPKPVTREKLLQSIEKISQPEYLSGVILRPHDNSEWLEGISTKVQELFSSIEESSYSSKDVLLVGPAGIPKRTLAQMIHNNSLNRKRRFVELSLSSFEKESSEIMFWTTIKELLSENPTDTRFDSQSCGTIFLDDFDLLPAHFQFSILEYLKSRGTQTDRTARIMLGVNNGATISKYDSEGIIHSFIKIDIVPLCERREDIPAIVNSYINNLSRKYNKAIKGVSSDAMNFFMVYDWPGDYLELEAILSSAVLKADSDFLQLSDFSIDFKMIIDVTLKKVLLKGDWKLTSAQEAFMKRVLDIVIKFSKGDVETASTLLDLPKTVIEEKIKHYGIKI